MTIQHPSWCSPEECTDGSHSSAVYTAAGSTATVTSYLYQGRLRDDEPVLVITDVYPTAEWAAASGEDPDEPLGSWPMRIEQAAQLRFILTRLIDAAGGPR